MRFKVRKMEDGFGVFDDERGKRLLKFYKYKKAAFSFRDKLVGLSRPIPAKPAFIAPEKIAPEMGSVPVVRGKKSHVCIWCKERPVGLDGDLCPACDKLISNEPSEEELEGMKKKPLCDDLNKPEDGSDE